jgi:hypothetical protein
MERGVTVYGQQVRAHNLMWALAELDGAKRDEIRSIAIVGGGVAGLTSTACALALFPQSKVSLFERSLDLCSLQQGCDTRWLHPRVYHWPEPGSRAPSASLPVLNWWEGRASDVADQILRGFERYIRHAQGTTQRLSVFLGVDYLSINPSSREMQWTGRAGNFDGPFVRADRATGQAQVFDRIVLAVGFGVEQQAEGSATPRYWHNDQLAHPRLDGSVRSYVVSGYGDGAVVDLCRLTIERFRQDRILYDVFGSDLEHAEARLYELYKERESLTSESIFQAFRDLERDEPFLSRALVALSARIRKDTRVVLHLRGGAHDANASLADVFGNKSSFANRMLLYLLYRCGAFTPTFASLNDVVRDHHTSPSHVVARYGPPRGAHVLQLFGNAPEVAKRLGELDNDQLQKVRLEWEPGAIPHYSD